MNLNLRCAGIRRAHCVKAELQPESRQGINSGWLFRLSKALPKTVYVFFKGPSKLLYKAVGDFVTHRTVDACKMVGHIDSFKNDIVEGDECRIIFIDGWLF